MKLRLQFLFSLLILFAPTLLHASTWYVRADGGSRYSQTAVLGQCDGLADAAYPGTGVNQHCAFGDFRYLYDDQSYGNINNAGGNWAIAGGDTVIIDNTKQWRVGFDGDASSTDPWCFGGNGPYGCYNPTIPSGTPSQHTRILGRNYASCNAGSAGDPTKMTQLFGGHGVIAVLNLQGAQNVDVECIELTRHSQCIVHGIPIFPSQCKTDTPIDDYDSNGMITDVNTQNVLMQDMWIHGHTNDGVNGPIGGVVTLNRVNIGYNGSAGWDMDNGWATPNAPGSQFLMHYSIVEWNGCNQEYPLVDTYPAIACYDQAFAGYGDGIGTPASNTLSLVSIDHSTFRYNTQDGADFGHIDTGSNTLTITDSLGYGNEGQAFKWGPGFTNAVFENNLLEANCARLSAAMTGAPDTYNTHLGSFCRANDTLSFNFVEGATALFANNTIVSYSPTIFDFQCQNSASCSSSVWNFVNNIVLGYFDPETANSGGQTPGPGVFCGNTCNETEYPIGTINRYNNIYYGTRSCPANTALFSSGGTVTGELCSDPGLVNEPASFVSEATLDNFNFGLAPGSAAIGAGLALAGLTTDYNGMARPTPPSLGALEYISAVGKPSPVGTTTRMGFWGAGIIGSLEAGIEVLPASGSGTPTGSVAFTVAGFPVGSLGLSSGHIVVVVPSWVAQFVITATYSGDANYMPSTVTLPSQ